MQSDTISLFDYAFSSGDLVFAAAVLLALAAFLLIFSSRRKIALQQSAVTEELLIHLGRIADALELQASRSPEQLIAELTAALKQQPHTPPQPYSAPQPAAISSEPNTIRYPLYNGEIPQDR